MWKDIKKYSKKFSSAVLTGQDDTGYPFSVRVVPELDNDRGLLRIQLPEDTPLLPGPACLLFHSHDDKIWNLKSFLVRGNLEWEKRGWYLRPQQFVPGMGIGGIQSYIHFMRNGRKNTKKYLEKRSMTWPQVLWEDIEDLIKG